MTAQPKRTAGFHEALHHAKLGKSPDDVGAYGMTEGRQRLLRRRYPEFFQEGSAPPFRTRPPRSAPFHSIQVEAIGTTWLEDSVSDIEVALEWGGSVRFQLDRDTVEALPHPRPLAIRKRIERRFGTLPDAVVVQLNEFGGVTITVPR